MKLLITGGTGSVGEGILRYLLNNPLYSEIIVLSRDEYKQVELRRKLGSSKLRFIIGDIRDKEALDKAFVGVDIIFHAAALKHVDIGEFMPEEFIKTNVLGTMNVFNAAEDAGVKKVVLLSTDKAAHAASVLGMTKGLAERLMIAHSRNSSGTLFCAVRLGNVLASRGSVIPFFIESIRNNKPLCVTDPKMTRFMISLSETAEFINFALDNGKQGDIFIKKCDVMELGRLAQALLNIFGSTLPISVIGRREGERVHEVLANQLELGQAEDLGGYYRISPQNDSERGQKPSGLVEYSSDSVPPLSLEATEEVLRSLELVKNSM